jgi:hypothetical protein
VRESKSENENENGSLSERMKLRIDRVRVSESVIVSERILVR